MSDTDIKKQNNNHQIQEDNIKQEHSEQQHSNKHEQNKQHEQQHHSSQDQQQNIIGQSLHFAQNNQNMFNFNFRQRSSRRGSEDNEQQDENQLNNYHHDGIQNQIENVQQATIQQNKQNSMCCHQQNNKQQIETQNKQNKGQIDRIQTKQKEIQNQQKQNLNQKQQEKIITKPIVDSQEQQIINKHQKIDHEFKVQQGSKKQTKVLLEEQVKSIIENKTVNSQYKQPQGKQKALVLPTKQQDNIESQQTSNQQQKQNSQNQVKVNKDYELSNNSNLIKSEDSSKSNKNIQQYNNGQNKIKLSTPTNLNTKQTRANNQKQYDKQMHDDLQNLKKNLVKKNKKQGFFFNDNKQKQSQKNKLNKTVLPVTKQKHLQFDETPETKAMQLKLISAMSQEKKKQNYHLLKQWDKRRAQTLAIHRNMIEILQSQIDKRIKSSIENLQIYTSFLREKAKQQQKYLALPVINTKYSLQNNSISKNVYINCTVILNALSDQNNQKCRKISDFVGIIRNDILRDSIQAHLLQSKLTYIFSGQKELLRIRQKISSLKATLRKCNSQTQEKTSELAMFFNQNALKMNFETQKDFYCTQIQFLYKASQQTSIQKKLGQNCLQYLQTATNQQIKRSKVIRQAMITFIKALQQCYSIEADPAEIQQLSKAEENKLIQQFYSLQQIFDERTLTVFKNHQSMDSSKQLSLQIFNSFLKKLQFQGFDCRMILLKQYNTKYLPTKPQYAALDQQSCYLVITVDNWIHLFLDKQKSAAYSKPDISFKATLKNLELKPTKNEILEIIIKDQRRSSMISYFWDTVSKSNERMYRIQFLKKDNREQFIDFVKKIRGN